tara:strand:- start:4392 stop:5369 length:978 start_codon:yes stop_codon:yes gene_type:complete
VVIGLQITKNKQKYKKITSLIDCSKIKNVSFIYIENDAALKKEFKKLDVLVTYKINSDLFKYRSKNLKWIHIGASGIEENLFEDLIKSKVMLTNAKGINSKPVAEFIISQIMYFAKQIKDCENFKLNKKWNQWELAKKTTQICDSTLGIIGYGEIGKELAKLAKSMGMKVLATRRLQKKIENKKFADFLMPLDKINFILENSNFIAITCPLTPLTKNMINKKSFKIMNKNSYLINTSRGKVVNEQDLISALKKKEIAGAALDVFSKEPLSEKSELFKLDNVFLSPHISGNFKYYQENMIKQFNQLLIKFIDNKTMKNRVCKKRLY